MSAEPKINCDRYDRYIIYVLQPPRYKLKGDLEKALENIIKKENFAMSNKQIICNKRVLIDFLVYSYFGIVPEKIFKNEKTELYGGFHDYDDYCIKKVIMAAYRDATNQGAYNTLFKKDLENIENLREESKEAQKKSALFLREKIYESKNLNMKNGFDEWHSEICKKLVEFYGNIKTGDDNFFTYGNAQKWVNMTMKYLWMLGLLPENIKEEDLHIPIDSFIMGVLQAGDLPKSSETNRIIGWSKWKEYQQYEKVQKKIKDEYTINSENNAWITRAEKRNKSTLRARYASFFGE